MSRLDIKEEIKRKERDIRDLRPIRLIRMQNEKKGEHKRYISIASKSLISGVMAGALTFNTIGSTASSLDVSSRNSNINPKAQVSEKVQEKQGRLKALDRMVPQTPDKYNPYVLENQFIVLGKITGKDVSQERIEIARLTIENMKIHQNRILLEKYKLNKQMANIIEKIKNTTDKKQKEEWISELVNKSKRIDKIDMEIEQIDCIIKAENQVSIICSRDNTLTARKEASELRDKYISEYSKIKLLYNVFIPIRYIRNGIWYNVNFELNLQYNKMIEDLNNELRMQQEDFNKLKR